MLKHLCVFLYNDKETVKVDAMCFRIDKAIQNDAKDAKATICCKESLLLRQGLLDMV